MWLCSGGSQLLFAGECLKPGVVLRRGNACDMNVTTSVSQTCFLDMNHSSKRQSQRAEPLAEVVTEGYKCLVPPLSAPGCFVALVGQAASGELE